MRVKLIIPRTLFDTTLTTCSKFYFPISTNMKKWSKEWSQYEDLDPGNQKRAANAWDAGKVDDEDIPDTAKNPAAESEAKEHEAKERVRKPKEKAEGDGEEPNRTHASKEVRIFRSFQGIQSRGPILMGTTAD